VFYLQDSPQKEDLSRQIEGFGGLVVRECENFAIQVTIGPVA